MLKFAMYSNVILLIIIPMILNKEMSDKNCDLNNLSKLNTLYILYNIISIILLSIQIVDVNWDFIYLFPISFLSIIFIIISNCNIKIKKINNTNYNSLNTKKYNIVSILPLIVFIIPYICELYIINNCSYLLEYSYNSGIISSEDSYIAVINNKPVSITLQMNLFNRKGISARHIYYNVAYTEANDVEITTRKTIVENENIRAIALDAKERFPTASLAHIDYYIEGKIAIIELTYGETNSLGEYFYYDNNYVKEIHTYGDLDKVTYYQ